MLNTDPFSRSYTDPQLLRGFPIWNATRKRYLPAEFEKLEIADGYDYGDNVAALHVFDDLFGGGVFEELNDGRFHVAYENQSKIFQNIHAAALFLFPWVETPKPSVNDLVKHYNEWLTQNQLPSMCASDLQFEPVVNGDQRDWLESFCHEWEAMEERDEAAG